MKIAIVGDPHIQEYVRERSDNYLDTVLKKLEFVAKSADKVILLGDLFSRPTNSDYLFYRVYSLMRRHEGKFMSLIGNHDIINRNYNVINKTTIGSLAKTGVLKLLTEDFTLGGKEFVVSFCERDKKEIPVDEECKKILLGHNYYEMDPSESFTREEIARLNYDLVFLGHDHQPHEDECIGGSILVRMGSLTRKDTSMYNKDRKPCFVIYDTEVEEYHRVEIPGNIAVPADRIFDMSVFEKKKVARAEVDYAQIGQLLEKFTKSGQGNISLDKVLRRIGTPEQCISYIKEVHDVAGLQYK